MARSVEARKIRAELDKELADTSARSGQNLVFTASERAILGLILDEIDRKEAILEGVAAVDRCEVAVQVVG
jgi:hypothetical protein